MPEIDLQPVPVYDLSVVVGSVDAEQSIAACIESLRASCTGLRAELIIVEAGVHGGTRRIVQGIPGIRLISLEAAALTPRLWAEGIWLSSGRVVALTTAHCKVGRDWARALLSSLTNGISAVGGPLTLSANATRLDAAIFFLRYSAFLDGQRARAVDQIAGDNSAYVHDSIPGDSWNRTSGFWEVDVNKAIRDSGERIIWNEEMTAEFGASFTLRSILRHRFEHARLFGAARVQAGESASRMVMKSPLVPAVLISRIARRVASRADYRMRFAAALPYIFLIATAWAAGEAEGAIRGSRANRS